jgi:ribosomal-protein-alanine N-acetyltransferase
LRPAEVAAQGAAGREECWWELSEARSLEEAFDMNRAMRVYLRALDIEDHMLINKWRNDAEIQSLTAGNRYYVSLAMEKRWVEEKALDNSKNVYWAICLSITGEMIGYTSVNNIDWRNRKAEWGGIVIGESAHRSKGYASEAAFLMMEYVFCELGLHRFWGHWLEDHTASVLMGKKLGFKEEGMLRDDVYKDGAFHNVVTMSILESEFAEVRKTYQTSAEK